MMNLAEHINRFWQLRRRMELSSQSADLYLFLLHECARNQGENPLQISDRLVATSLALSRYKLRKARHSLFEEGLILYNTGDGARPTEYRLCLVAKQEGFRPTQRKGLRPEDYDVRMDIPLPSETTQTAIPEKVLPEEESQQTEKLLSPVSLAEVIHMYHTGCPHLPRVKSETSQRQYALSKALDEMQRHSGLSDLRPILHQLFEKIAQSKFLQGQNSKGWRANFDWVFRTEGRNWEKILKGNYDSRTVPPRSTNEASNRLVGQLYHPGMRPEDWIIR